MKKRRVSGYKYRRKNTKGIIEVKGYSRKERPKAKKIRYGKPITIKAVPKLDEYNQIRGYKWKSFKRK